MTDIQVFTRQCLVDGNATHDFVCPGDYTIVELITTLKNIYKFGSFNTYIDDDFNSDPKLHFNEIIKNENQKLNYEIIFSTEEQWFFRDKVDFVKTIYPNATCVVASFDYHQKIHGTNKKLGHESGVHYNIYLTSDEFNKSINNDNYKKDIHIENFGPVKIKYCLNQELVM
jgi:hypothetical protein